MGIIKSIINTEVSFYIDIDEEIFDEEYNYDEFMDDCYEIISQHLKCRGNLPDYIKVKTLDFE